jgi:hypothetical protein
MGEDITGRRSVGMLVVAIIRHLGEYFDFSSPEPVRCQTVLSDGQTILSDSSTVFNLEVD